MSVTYLVLTLGDEYKDFRITIDYPDGRCGNPKVMDPTLNITNKKILQSGNGRCLSFNIDVEMDESKNSKDTLKNLPTQTHRNTVVVKLESLDPDLSNFKKIIFTEKCDDKDNVASSCLVKLQSGNKKAHFWLYTEYEYYTRRIFSHVQIGLGSVLSQNNGRNLAFNEIFNCPKARHFERLYYDSEQGSVLLAELPYLENGPYIVKRSTMKHIYKIQKTSTNAEFYKEINKLAIKYLEQRSDPKTFNMVLYSEVLNKNRSITGLNYSDMLETLVSSLEELFKIVRYNEEI